MAEDEIPDLIPGAASHHLKKAAPTRRPKKASAAPPQARERAKSGASTARPSKADSSPRKPIEDGEALSLDDGPPRAVATGGDSSGDLLDELEFDPISSRSAMGMEDFVKPPSVSPKAFSNDVEIPLLDLSWTDSEEASDSRSQSSASSSSASSLPRTVPALDTSSLPPKRSSSPGERKAQPKGVKKARGGQASKPPGQHLSGNFPSMAGDVDLGDALDDLEWSGASAAQLNVAVELPREDTAPWPTGKTPESDEIELDDEEIAQTSGFGPPPNGIFNAPMYFVRVYLALGQLKETLRVAQEQLLAIEQSRDEKLCQMAESKRLELSDKDRFAILYQGVNQHDERISLKKNALQVADTEGAEELREINAKMDSLAQVRSKKEKERNARRVNSENSELEMKRAKAVIRKVEIGERNLMEQQATGYDFGVVSFDIRMGALFKDEENAKAVIASCLKNRKQVGERLEEAEDSLRQVVAEGLALEARKEGLLMALEGEIAEHSRELDEAISARRKNLADAGRVILDLRGEVPVDVSFRQELVEIDRQVRDAFSKVQVARAALDSMDQETFRLGRSIWIGLAAVFVLVLVFGAVL